MVEPNKELPEPDRELDAHEAAAAAAPQPPDSVQRAVRQLEAREVGELLVPACSDVLLLLDHQRRICYVSPSVERVLGRVGEEVHNRDLAAFVHPGNRSAAIDALDNAARELDWSAPIECRMEHADGSWRHVELFSRSLESRRGVPVLGSVTTVRDITQRKRAELELERAARHEQLLSQLPSPVMVVTPEGRFRYANAAAVTTLDSGSLSKLLDRSLVDLTVEGQRHELLRALERAAAGHRGADVRTRVQPTTGGPTLDMELRLIAESWEDDAAAIVIAHDVTGWADSQQELTRRALYDDLTGLPNRTLLHDRLEHALAHAHRSGHQPMIMFLDIDRFKNVNDSLGHGAGDQLLVEVAARLEDVVRPQDTVARLGGDEFVVLIEHSEGADHAMSIARRVARTLARDIPVDGASVPVTASIGVAAASDVDDPGPDRLIQAADTAMYRAKASGGGIEFYTAALRESALDRLRLETDLRHAVANGELSVAYQPLVTLPDKRVVGAEALARWSHPERGEVPPDVFIPVAEDTGLIDALCRQVIQASLHAAGRWQSAGLLPDDFSMAVNVSPGQLADDSLLEHLRSLGVSGSGPVSVQFEVTERVLMDDERAVTTTLQQLREIGIGIAIDDFGTGYSSLAYLSRLPVDALKLDRRFVRRLDHTRSARVAGAVVALGQALDVLVVAEGVESAADEQAVRDLGVSRGQGFHFGRPMPPEHFTAALSSSP